MTALKTCQTETYEGSKLTYSPVSVAHSGEGSAGLRFTGDAATAVQMYVLEGPALITIGGGGVTSTLPSTNSDLVARLLAKQVDRYTTAATHLSWLGTVNHAGPAAVSSA